VGQEERHDAAKMIEKQLERMEALIQSGFSKEQR